MTERLISSELCTIPMNALKGGEKGVRAQRGNSIYEVIFVFEGISNKSNVLSLFSFVCILFLFFSIMVYYRVLNIVPCAVWWDLSYPFCI